MAAIPEEVPEYARPFEGAFGRGVRRGVHEALREFTTLVRDPDSDRQAARGVYFALGNGELRQGRTLDSLQAAYRVGARVAWRRVAAAAQAAGYGADVLSPLAESIFAFIDEVSADSVEGYAQAQSEREGERERRRRALVSLLLLDPPAEAADLRAASQAAGWAFPRRAAVLACDARDLAGVTRGLGADVLAAAHDGIGCAIVPDADGPGRRDAVERAAGGVRVGLGPTEEIARIGESWALALAALRAASSSRNSGLVAAEDRLAELLLRENRAITARIAGRRLAALAGLTPRARGRMEETALAFVQERGNAAGMARAMEVHPQTARYRLARLRELMGDDLDDPDARFELEIALRATTPERP